MHANGLHMACGGFGALSCPPKPKLATERKPCGKPFTRHKLYAVLCKVYLFKFFVLKVIGQWVICPVTKVKKISFHVS